MHAHAGMYTDQHVRIDLWFLPDVKCDKQVTVIKSCFEMLPLFQTLSSVLYTPFFDSVIHDFLR